MSNDVKAGVIITIPDVLTSTEDLNWEEAREHPGPLPDAATLSQRGLRRNSISLPELNSIQMDALQKIHAEIDENQQQVGCEVIYFCNLDIRVIMTKPGSKNCCREVSFYWWNITFVLGLRC